MADITMCNNSSCWLRLGCRRSPDSGTKPHDHQSWAAYSPMLAKVGQQLVIFCPDFSPFGLTSQDLETLAGTIWCYDMSIAPRNKRLLVKSAVNGEIYVAHWVKNIETDDESWLISEAADGSQHLCKAKAWRFIPEDGEI
jgi:hypothetical protein